METKAPNIIADKTLDFGVKIVRFTESLQQARKFVVADQLLRSGTSVGANTWEAQNTSTPKEFVRALKIALKEAGETEYWLHLCRRSDSYIYDEALMNDLQEIKRILSKIVITTKNRMKQNKQSKKSATR